MSKLNQSMEFTSSGGDIGLFSLGNFSFPSLPDPRGFSIRVRYSLSDLPTNNGYRSRLADDRVGYFITAYQTPLDYRRRDPFVRYIQRWRLEKQNSEVELSPPKEPIVFLDRKHGADGVSSGHSRRGFYCGMRHLSRQGS